MKIALITGGRHFSDEPFLYSALDSLLAKYEFNVIVHGDATGADSLADKWAKERGIQRFKVPANWIGDGQKAAGSKRNRLMYDFFKPDLCIAFEGGSGTANMMKICYDADVKVVDTLDEVW